MGFFSKGDPGSSGKQAAAAPSPSIKKYNYGQFLEEGKQPSNAAVQAAAGYSQRAASSAALEMQLESSKKRRPHPQGRPRRSVLCAPGRIWMHLLTGAQVAVAIGLIAVVAACLNRQETATLPSEPDKTLPPVTYSICYATTRPTNTCWYSYWAAAASIALSVTVSLMQFCCPRRRQTMCLSLEAVLGLVGAAWWIAAGVTDLVFANEANSSGLPYSTCRTVSWILCFVNAGLFTLSFISSTASCCAACGGYTDEEEDLTY